MSNYDNSEATRLLKLGIKLSQGINFETELCEKKILKRNSASQEDSDILGRVS